jgi:hypothetical protein
MFKGLLLSCKKDELAYDTTMGQIKSLFKETENNVGESTQSLLSTAPVQSQVLITQIFLLTVL